jgi:recombination protein RecT
MAKDNTTLATTIQQSGGIMTPTAFSGQCGAWFKANGKRMGNLWGSEDAARRALLVAMQTVNANPYLLKCSIDSFFECLLTASELRLLPGPMQECAFVPFAGKAKFVPMYQGLVKLCYNSGVVKSLTANVVYDADDFDFLLGSEQYLKHKPFLGPRSERGERMCVYSCIRTVWGDSQIVVLPISFIEGIKARSAGAKRSDSPWSNGNPDDYDAMAKKTALKQALKFVPKSTELARAIAADDADSVDIPAFDFAGAVSVAVEAAGEEIDAKTRTETAAETGLRN